MDIVVAASSVIELALFLLNPKKRKYSGKQNIFREKAQSKASHCQWPFRMAADSIFLGAKVTV
jgi:hypothetical protein